MKAADDGGEEKQMQADPAVPPPPLDDKQSELASPPTDWRDALPRLEPLGLPLLPCGAGADGKSPVDPKTGYGLSRWQKARFTVPEILAMNGKVRSVGTRTGEGLVSFDIDGGTAIELTLAEGCDPQKADTWQVHRTTDPLRLKVNFTLTPEQQQQLGEVTAKAITAPPAPGKKGEAVELFHSPGRQVLLLGEHPESSGYYVWPDGCGPEDLKPIPANWWAMALKIAAGELGINPTPTTRPSGKAPTSSGKEWRPIGGKATEQCPICGAERNGAGYCSKHRTRGTIRCFHGNTYSPEFEHGPLKKGPKINGRDGETYGYSSTKAQKTGEVFSAFVIHRERSNARQPIRAIAGAQPASIAESTPGDGDAGANSTPAAVLSRQTRVSPDEVLTLLPDRLGALQLNIRSGEVHSSSRGVISANEISRIYLELSRPYEVWAKDATADGITLLASRNPFDPVVEYLDGITAEPLPMEQWQRLDQHLLGITDPIAARFLPRYLISAVARVFEPAAYVRQVPVLIGAQERGKGELGRILFGADNWVEGVGGLDRDALMKAHTAWGVELAELDGVTRRADQEHLKAFITETADTYRKPYDRAPERHARKFVFWGTANKPPLRDPSGSTRFVCIPIPDRPLPLEWARKHRDALWARAVQQYRSGVTWLRTSEEERLAVEDRNADFTEQDPWADPVGEYLANALKHDWRLPVKVGAVLAHLEVEQSRQTNALAKRVREIAEAAGWCHARRRPNKGADPVKGLWPPEEAVHPVHPVHPEVLAGVHSSDPSDGLASGNAVHPVHPNSRKVEKEDGAAHTTPADAACDASVQEGFESFGVHGVHTPQTDCAPVDLPCSVGVHSGVHSGVQPTWMPQLLAIRNENPGQQANVYANALMSRHGIDVGGRKVKELLKQWDARQAPDVAA